VKRILPFVFLIVLLLAGILAVPFLLNPDKHRQEISDTLSKLLNRPVVIGKLSMSYLPPTLQAEQDAVMGSGGVPVLQVGTASAPLDWVALFHLKFVPQEVTLDHWILTIQRKPDGGWDIEDYLPGTSGLSGAKSWTLQRVYWKAGEIHWVDPYAAASQELVLGAVEGQWDPRPEMIDAQGTFSGIAAGVHATLNAKGQFFSTPQWSGDLQFTDQSNSASFHLSKNTDGAEIKGQAAKWNLANALSFLKFYARANVATVDGSSPLALENWQLHAKWGNKHLSFEHSATISGGQSEMKGSIDSGPSGLVAHADIATKDIPVESVLNLTGQKLALNGKLTLVMKNFEMALSSAALSSVKGEGYAELTDGHYQLPDVTAKKLSRAKTMVYMKKKFPDLLEKGFPITKLAAHWNVKSGFAQVADGHFTSTDMKAGWVGKLDLAREGIDGYLRLQIREKDQAKLALLPEKYKDQPAYGRLQGTWYAWTLKAYAASKVPMNVRDKLTSAIKAK
jgi:hypothetical protein